MSVSPKSPHDVQMKVLRYKEIEGPVIQWFISTEHRDRLNLLSLNHDTAAAEIDGRVPISLPDIEVVSKRIASAKAVSKMPEEIARSLYSMIDLKHEVAYWYRSNAAPGDHHRESKNLTHKNNTNEWHRARKRILHLYPASARKTSQPSTPTDAAQTRHKGSAAAQSHSLTASRVAANTEANSKVNNAVERPSQQKADEDSNSQAIMSDSEQELASVQQERPTEELLSPDSHENYSQTKIETSPKLQNEQNTSEQPPLNATTSPHGSKADNESDRENPTAVQTKAKRKPNLARKQKKKSKTKLKQQEEALIRLPTAVQHDGAAYLLDRGATLQARASGMGMQNIWGEGGDAREGRSEPEQESTKKGQRMVEQEAFEKQESIRGKDSDADSKKDDGNTTAGASASAEAVAQAGTAWASSHSKKWY